MRHSTARTSGSLGLEQDVVGREAAKLEREVHDLVLAVAEHRMAEFEAVFGAMIRQHDAWP